MGYLYLEIALLAGVTKGYCGKKTSGFVRSFHESALLNTARMVLCIVIGFFFALFSESGLSFSALTPQAVLICLLSGISLSGFVVTWILSVQRGAYMMIEISLLLGVLIPMLYCRFAYAEPITPLQWLGLALLVFATYLMTVYNRSQRGEGKRGAVLLYVLCGAFSGCADLSQKLFVHEIPQVGASAFNFYTYIVSSLVLLTFFLLSREKKTPPAEEEKFLKTVLPYLLVMAACLFLNSFFKTVAAGSLPAAVVYPLSQGGSLLLSLAMSAFLFKEKITPRCLLGVITAFAALLLMNVFG